VTVRWEPPPNGRGHSRPRITVVADRTRLFARVGGEIVILDEEEGAYYGFQGVGARVWELLQEPRSVDEIVAALMREYDVEDSRCRHDLADLLEELSRRGMVTRHDEHTR
jgi:hypothetical protein